MARLAIIDDLDIRQVYFVTVHLSDADIATICDEATPAKALASAVRALDGAAPVDRVIDAIASRTAWRLRQKNKRHGRAGLKIVFTLDLSITALDRRQSYALATCRIREPAWRTSNEDSNLTHALINQQPRALGQGEPFDHLTSPSYARRILVPGSRRTANSNGRGL